MLPNHDYDEVNSFKTRYLAGQEYSVEVKNEHQHIVHDKTENIWAYALFSSDQYSPVGPLKGAMLTEAKANEKGQILEADDAIVAIVRQNADLMEVAVAYPDLRLFDGVLTGYNVSGNKTYSAPVVITIELEGSWKLSSSIDGVTYNGGSDTTLLSIELVDGLTKTLVLNK